MDPRTQQIMAEVLIGRGNRAAQGTNPYGAAFGGLAQILAQLNLGKATNALEKAAQDKEEQDRQNRIQAMVNAGVPPEAAEAAVANPALAGQIYANATKQPEPVDRQQMALNNMPVGQAAIIEQLIGDANKMTPESMEMIMGALDNSASLAQGQGVGVLQAPDQMFDPSKVAYREKPPSGLDKMAGAVGDLAGAIGESRTVQTDEEGNKSSQPTSAMDNLLQKDLASVDELQGRLDSIVLENADELLTRGGKAKSWFAKQANEWLGDALPGDDNSGIEGAVEERVRLATEFKNQSMQLFNVYRKLITGAAASVQELKMLLDSYLNSEMGPEEFKASYQVVKQSLERDRARLVGYITDGMPLEKAQARVVAEGQADKVAEAMNEALGEIDEEEDDSDPLGLFR